MRRTAVLSWATGSIHCGCAAACCGQQGQPPAVQPTLRRQVWAGSRYGMQGHIVPPAHDSLHWPPSPEHGAAVGHCTPKNGLVVQHWMAAMQVDPHIKGSALGQVVKVT